MWSDNETDLDLLGVEYLVDEVLVALTSPKLQPLTVGVLGEWGSGKSSLLRVIDRELSARRDADTDQPEYVTVNFSPWQYEDYGDVKLALMRSVLEACEKAYGETPRTRGLKAFIQSVAGFGRQVLRVGVQAAPTALAGAMASVDPSALDPVLIDTATKAASSAVGLVDERLRTDAQAAHDVDEAASPVSSLAEFRVKYAEMVEELPIRGVVVFIDDLDRCLPPTVVDTFEAIRLFLNGPMSSFVIAVHRQIAEAAIDAAFPAYVSASTTSLGHDYLEKMLQLQVVLPELSLDDTYAYVGLLFCELHLDQADFLRLCAAVSQRRQESPLSRGFDITLAAELLGQAFSDPLRVDLEWAEEIVPVIAYALRGNPRQTKRFLNDVRLRFSAAHKRGITLDGAILAKLMVLHELDLQALQQLYDWQRQSSGPIPELREAEGFSIPGEHDDSRDDDQNETSTPPADQRRRATRGQTAASGRSVGRGGRNSSDAHGDEPSAVEVWARKPTVKRWLDVAPQLGGIDLRPYFMYFRGSLRAGSLAWALPEKLSLLLARLMDENASRRRRAADEFVNLTPEEQDQLWDAIQRELRVRPAGSAWEAAYTVAGRSPRFSTSLASVVVALPEALVPVVRVPQLLANLESEDRATVRDKWAGSGVRALATVANTGLATGR